MNLIAAWASCDPAELRARLRALQGIARILAGPGSDLVDALRAAEHDPGRLAACDAALARLPALPMRRVLATFAATLPDTVTAVAHGTGQPGISGRGRP